MVLTIENLTTFHSEARRRSNEDLLLVYTTGMPWAGMAGNVIRILTALPAHTPVYHWGDIDEEGFRIAGTLAEDARTVGHTLRHGPCAPRTFRSIFVAEPRPTHWNEFVVSQMQLVGRDLGEAIAIVGFTVEQESVTPHKNE